jgi:hypothetical protein
MCVAVAAFAPEVQVDYDRSANFGAYRTYQWVETNPFQVGDQLLDKNIKRAVDAQLAGKGLPRVESTSSTIEIGKLVIALFDPATKQLVWRGSASKTLDINEDPDKNYRNLEKAVAKLFKNYPPTRVSADRPQ